MSTITRPDDVALCRLTDPRQQPEGILSLWVDTARDLDGEAFMTGEEISLNLYVQPSFDVKHELLVGLQLSTTSARSLIGQLRKAINRRQSP
jgi:hypothetical protein